MANENCSCYGTGKVSVCGYCVDDVPHGSCDDSWEVACQSCCPHQNVKIRGNEETGYQGSRCGDCGASLARFVEDGEYVYKNKHLMYKNFPMHPDYNVSYVGPKHEWDMLPPEVKDRYISETRDGRVNAYKRSPVDY